MTLSKFEDVWQKKPGAVDPMMQIPGERGIEVGYRPVSEGLNRNEPSRILMQGYKWLVVVRRWVDGLLELAKTLSDSI